MTHVLVSKLFILNWRNFFCYLEFSGFPPIKSQLIFQFSIIHSHVRLHKPFFTIKDINPCHLQKKKKLTYRIEINFSPFSFFLQNALNIDFKNKIKCTFFVCQNGEENVRFTIQAFVDWWLRSWQDLYFVPIQWWRL